MSNLEILRLQPIQRSSIRYDDVVLLVVVDDVVAIRCPVHIQVWPYNLVKEDGGVIPLVFSLVWVFELRASHTRIVLSPDADAKTFGLVRWKDT